MAKKKKGGDGLKSALRELSPGGITKTELKKIVNQTGASAQDVIKRMDAMNQAGQDVRLNSGAANMLIKQAQPSTPGEALAARVFGNRGQETYGSGKIGRALQGMMGSVGYSATYRPGGESGAGGSTAATPAQLMIGGTQIRPGGRVAVRDRRGVGGATDTAGATDGAAADGTAAGGGADAYDYQSMLDAITGIQQPEFDMSSLTDMFNTQFDALTSQFDAMNPLRLAQVGKSYAGDAIKGGQRYRKTAADYRRSLPSIALGQALANMAIGGGLTI